MESTSHEQHVTPKVAKTLREKIIAFHDRHLKVSPITEDAVSAFEEVAKAVTSTKAQAAVERIRPHIADWSKNAEVWAAAGDMVLSVAGATVAVDALLLEKRRIDNMAGKLSAPVQMTGASELKIAARSRVKRGFGGAAFAGIFGGIRPVSRLAHRVGIPIARRIALSLDNIMLKKEQKMETKQVFVGQGKA